MPRSTRRELLGGAAAVVIAGPVRARTIANEVPWRPNEAYPPAQAEAGPLQFFAGDEAATLDAIVDRLIPSDELGPGGKDAGCTIFIDRQLAGPFGVNEGLYNEGPFAEHPLPSQGLQSPLNPREQYRKGLAALAEYCRSNFSGRKFEQLSAAEQDGLLADMEKGKVELPGFSSRPLFGAVLVGAMEGFFADPIYGGNRGMAGWKLVGFPGTRYDYRDIIDNPNTPYTLPPVSIRGRAEWDNPAAAK
jgi:gluconate 2-dehydrogenase gamma chain